MTASPVPETAKKIPGGVWVLGFVSLLMDMSSEAIHALLPLFLVTTLGASAATVGLIEGLAEATAPIVKLFSGALSDRLGRRKPLAVAGYLASALTKPLFALASGAGLVLAARLLDRIGKGVRGAPRDALIADVTPADLRGAAFGLRQALDTVGAFIGPLLAVGLMLASHDNFRLVFWVATVPALACVALLAFGLREPARVAAAPRATPIGRAALFRLGAPFWRLTGVGALFAFARFSEAFLVLRVQQGGVAIALVPLVMAAMNVVYALAAYPLGALSDRIGRRNLLPFGLLALLAADLLLGASARWEGMLAGVLLWGVHLAATQGLFSAMVADVAPAELRGSAFGLFNLVSGVALLAASLVAGILWDRFGAPATFYCGAAICLTALTAFYGARVRR
jgi:MFS family permease